MVGVFHIWKVRILSWILFSGRTEYSDRKAIKLTHYTIPCLPLSNTVVVCYGRVHCRIQSWIPGSVLVSGWQDLAGPADWGQRTDGPLGRKLPLGRTKKIFEVIIYSSNSSNSHTAKR